MKKIDDKFRTWRKWQNRKLTGHIARLEAEIWHRRLYGTNNETAAIIVISVPIPRRCRDVSYCVAEHLWTIAWHVRVRSLHLCSTCAYHVNVTDVFQCTGYRRCQNTALFDLQMTSDLQKWPSIFVLVYHTAELVNKYIEITQRMNYASNMQIISIDILCRTQLYRSATYR